MTGPIVYVDRSTIQAGSGAALKEAVARLVRFVEEREPRLLAYSFHLNEREATMTVVAVHPDPASLELHLRLGGPEFRKLARLIELREINVYGEPGDACMELLHDKARALGSGVTVTPHPRQAGFDRLAS